MKYIYINSFFLLDLSRFIIFLNPIKETFMLNKKVKWFNIQKRYEFIAIVQRL